jgi:hypothetical protein
LTGDYEPAPVYIGLRNLIFDTKVPTGNSRELGPASDVFGVVMETGYSTAVATLVAVGDDTVSLYFSNGGGIIGLGPHEGPRRVSRALLDLASQFTKHCIAAADFPLPRKGHTRFYLLTRNGAVTADGAEDELRPGRHALSPLYYKCHELIAAIRTVREQQEAKKARPPDA